MLCLIAPKQRSKFTRLILLWTAKKLKYPKLWHKHISINNHKTGRIYVLYVTEGDVDPQERSIKYASSSSYWGAFTVRLCLFVKKGTLQLRKLTFPKNWLSSYLWIQSDPPKSTVASGESQTVEWPHKSYSLDTSKVSTLHTGIPSFIWTVSD